MKQVDLSSLSALSSMQRSVLEFYLNALGPPATQAQLHRAGWSGEIGGRSFPRREITVAQVVVALDDGSSVHFYGSLGDSAKEIGVPVDHEHQFLSMFDIPHEDIVHLVAYARVHHLSAAPLDAHSSFLLDESNPLRRRGYTNVLVTRADLLSPFHNRNSAKVSGVPMQFLGLIPLEPQEWQIKVEQGTDAVFDDFATRERDLLTLRPRMAGDRLVISDE